MHDYNTGAGVEDDRGGQVGQTVREEVDRRSTAAGDQATAVSGAIGQAGTELESQGNDLPAQAAERAAGQLDRAGRYLRESDGDRILSDVEDFARRQPWVVAGIALAAGLAAARLLKASLGGSRRGFFSGETRR